MIGREAIELLLLAAFGAFPASLLSRRFDVVTRVALAPILGFAIGIDLFTSTLNYWSGNETSWLVPFVASLSLLGCIVVVVARAAHVSIDRKMFGRTVLGILQLFIVCAAISMPILWSFHEANSTGPAAYEVSDSIAYVTETDGAQLQSLTTAAAESNKGGNQLISYWASYVQADQRVDAAPLLANIDSFVGLSATETQSSFLLVILILGGLGVFSVVRYLMSSFKWVSTIAGALFGGSMFLQLFFDGSQAALCALALIGAMLALGIVAIREKRVADCVALAFVFAALMSVYPYYTPEVVVAVAAVLAVLTLRRALPRYRTGALRSLLTGAGLTVLVGGLSVVVNTIGFSRMVHATQTYSSSISGQPNYSFLVPRVVPSWLTQSQGLYALALSTHPLVENVLLALIAPLVLLVFIFSGARRNRILLVTVPLIAMFVFAAVYARVHTYTGFPDGCTYCEDRNLLPVVPILIILGFVGLGALLASRRLLVKVTAALGSVALLGSIAFAAYESQELLESGSYFLPNSIGTLLSKIPSNSHGAIEAEGFDEAVPNPVASMNFVYLAVDERFPGRASWAAGNDENSDETYYYDPTTSLKDLRYQPLYQYVLTRIDGVRTNRQLIGKIGSIGLYKRANPLDVTVDYGLTVTYPSDATGDTPTPDIFAPEPMQFVVSGGSSSKSAYVRLVFTRSTPNPTVTPSDGSTATVHLAANRLDVCVTTAGVAPSRTATLSVSPIPGTYLLQMTASYRPCS